MRRTVNDLTNLEIENNNQNDEKFQIQNFKSCRSDNSFEMNNFYSERAMLMIQNTLNTVILENLFSGWDSIYKKTYQIEQSYHQKSFDSLIKRIQYCKERNQCRNRKIYSQGKNNNNRSFSPLRKLKKNCKNQILNNIFNNLDKKKNPNISNNNDNLVINLRLKKLQKMMLNIKKQRIMVEQPVTIIERRKIINRIQDNNNKPKDSIQIIKKQILDVRQQLEKLKKIELENQEKYSRNQSLENSKNQSLQNNRQKNYNNQNIQRNNKLTQSINQKLKINKNEVIYEYKRNIIKNKPNQFIKEKDNLDYFLNQHNKILNQTISGQKNINLSPKIQKYNNYNNSSCENKIPNSTINTTLTRQNNHNSNRNNNHYSNLHTDRINGSSHSAYKYQPVQKINIPNQYHNNHYRTPINTQESTNSADIQAKTINTYNVPSVQSNRHGEVKFIHHQPLNNQMYPQYYNNELNPGKTYENMHRISNSRVVYKQKYYCDGKCSCNCHFH